MASSGDFSLPTFENADWLQRALTHKSYLQEHPNAPGDNERLEFLGDAILTFLCGEFLFQQFPDAPEGDLTILRASLVDKTQLAAFARLLQLGQRLRLSRGIENSGGRTNSRLLSSAFEALIGAYYLDSSCNIEPVREYVFPFFRQGLAGQPGGSATLNVKSKLQEWALANHGVIPEYIILAAEGPDHAKRFTAEVRILKQVYGQGQGGSKQAAEKAAARAALISIGELREGADGYNR
jgi:ribonuclease-3